MGYGDEDLTAEDPKLNEKGPLSRRRLPLSQALPAPRECCACDEGATAADAVTLRFWRLFSTAEDGNKHARRSRRSTHTYTHNAHPCAPHTLPLLPGSGRPR